MQTKGLSLLHLSCLGTLLLLPFNVISSLGQNAEASFLETLKSLGGAKSQNPLVIACQRGLDFASLQEFREFTKHFKQLSLEQMRSLRFPNACLEHREAILELEGLLQQNCLRSGTNRQIGQLS